MANHWHKGHGEVHHNSLDFLNWPVIGIGLVGGVSGAFNSLWEHVPGPTAVYMGISAAFMLFQMSDKLGLLERLKRKTKEPS